MIDVDITEGDIIQTRQIDMVNRAISYPPPGISERERYIYIYIDFIRSAVGGAMDLGLGTCTFAVLCRSSGDVRGQCTLR